MATTAAPAPRSLLRFGRGGLQPLLLRRGGVSSAARGCTPALARNLYASALTSAPSTPPGPSSKVQAAGFVEKTSWQGREKEVSEARRFKGQNFPEWLEAYSRTMFYQMGAGGIGITALSFGVLGVGQESILVGAVTAGFWYVGLKDMRSKKAIRRNFPVLGNIRYLCESIRPEIRQYFVESDSEAEPYDRAHRSIVYQRAKNSNDTMPLGTRRDVYQEGYEWVGHSMWPQHVDPESDAMRCTIGGPDCKQKYSASLLNISAMSYGSLSENAILALNKGARIGNFYHNTGEGGISRFHLQPGGDIVWNVGTGYFGCRTREGQFCPDMFADTVSQEQIRMVEIKLSQGAKPGHGGILPKSKLTDFIREARGLPADWNEDVNSPPSHSAFTKARSLMEFVARLRELSGGKPVGFKMCVGRPQELAAVVRAMVETGITPDFITVDGGEGGTGAAPPEFSNSVGMPMIEGLSLTHNLLSGAGVRDDVKIICSGRVLSGFSIVRNLALGADVCNAARAFMFSLGCIQALKCNTNKCPTGVATQDVNLMAGLDPTDKANRVFNFHANTMESAAEICGAAGYAAPGEFQPQDIHRRMSGGDGVLTYDQMYPILAKGELLHGTAPPPQEGGTQGATTFYGGPRRASGGGSAHHFYHKWWDESQQYL